MKYTIATCEKDFAIIKKLNTLNNPKTYWENAIKILGISEEQARKTPLALARYREIDKENTQKTFANNKIGSRTLVYAGFFGAEIDAFNLADIKTKDFSLCCFDNIAVLVSHLPNPELYTEIKFPELAKEALLEASNKIIKQYMDGLISYGVMKTLWREELLKRAKTHVAIYNRNHS